VAHAQRHPVLWDQIRDTAVGDDKPVLALADRNPSAARPPSENLIVGSYRIAYSVEEQPAGMCRHLSVSTLRPGRVPPQVVVAEVLVLFGFVTGNESTRFWLEEFDPGHHAVNAVQLIAERIGGHA
jgi:hypothetical protein